MLKYSIKVLALFTIIFTSCEKKQRTINNEIKLSVIPHPNDLIIYDNHFALNNDTKIVASNTTQTQVAERFIKQLYSDFGINCNVSSNNTNSENTIALIEDKTIQNEGYILDSYIDKVLIKASTSAGYYYGLQTLLQTRIAELDNEIHLNLTHIKDAPKFEWRGVMLDLSRHFFGVESIKTLVDEINTIYRKDRFFILKNHLIRLKKVKELTNEYDSPNIRTLKNDFMKIIDFGTKNNFEIIKLAKKTSFFK